MEALNILCISVTNLSTAGQGLSYMRAVQRGIRWLWNSLTVMSLNVGLRTWCYLVIRYHYEKLTYFAYDQVLKHLVIRQAGGKYMQVHHVRTFR